MFIVGLLCRFLDRRIRNFRLEPGDILINLKGILVIQVKSLLGRCCSLLLVNSLRDRKLRGCRPHTSWVAVVWIE